MPRSLYQTLFSFIVGFVAMHARVVIAVSTTNPKNVWYCGLRIANQFWPLLTVKMVTLWSAFEDILASLQQLCHVRITNNFIQGAYNFDVSEDKSP